MYSTQIEVEFAVDLSYWFYSKMQKKAMEFNVYIAVADANRTKEGRITASEEDTVTCFASIVNQTDKAYRLKFRSGLEVGSVNGWTTWVPKSQCKIHTLETA